jgi:hypothetical protein
MWAFAGAAAAVALVILGLMSFGRGDPAGAPRQPIAQAPIAPLQPTSGSIDPPPVAGPVQEPVGEPVPRPTPVVESRDVMARRNIEAATGMVTDAFALCQTMPLEQFAPAIEALRQAGYRPLRARPYATPEGVLMAAVWTRDEVPWVFKSDLSPDELQAENQRQAGEGFVPADVAAWQTGTDLRLTLGLWARTGEDPKKFEIYAAAPHAEQQERYEDCRQRGLRPLQRHAFLGSDDELYHSFLWNRHGRAFYSGTGHRTFYEKQILPNRLQVDVGLRNHLSGGRRDVWYYGVWEITTKRQSAELHGLTPQEHLEQCRKLAAQGKRPVAIGVLFVSPEQPWMAASVWH